MPGLWKGWKAKSRLPPLSTSPLEISPTPGEIPTFPQRRRRGRMEKLENQEQVFHFPTAPRIDWEEPKQNQHLLNTTRKEMSSRHQGRPCFQAHPALESTGRFRLISRWSQILISGSFMDWKMLRLPRSAAGLKLYHVQPGNHMEMADIAGSDTETELQRSGRN